MTTDDTATLLYWLATGKFKETEKMLFLMARDLKTHPDDRNRAVGGVPKGRSSRTPTMIRDPSLPKSRAKSAGGL